ncbi:response regulator transcription factor [Paraburkholderia bonniea]|uniref:response regulator transcription factor n=1 Tax=Paraburkholderia bonniea TaxID=2152891 RepID=UPI0012926EB4|nr:response regulator transcription factor [Paraburkholderia bonniea]WJF89284.1 response regulator transcription factor [Paraburkholderia bonniea]WJF92600.1 response regulator transcription factor [Paraburkholderia bonniea]
MATALLVDDHAMFREGLALALEQGEPTLRIQTVSSGEEAVRALGTIADLSIVLMDYYLPDMNGTTLVERLRRTRPGAPVLVLSASDDPEDYRSALAAGACGFIHKSSDSAVLLDAVRRVLRGEALSSQPFPRAALRVQNDADAVVLKLTQRQREVLGLLCEGLRNGAIAERLSMTEKTVKAHVSAIFMTLDVPSRTQAVLVAMRSQVYRDRKDR